MHRTFHVADQQGVISSCGWGDVKESGKAHCRAVEGGVEGKFDDGEPYAE